jgi:hypothetical protein
MKGSSCRFVLSKVIEDEVAHEYSYDIFEPTVGLEIAGRNIFKELGLDGADRVVIMHFLEVALGKTLRLIDDISRDPSGEYEFWLLGSEYGIELQRRGNILDVMLQVGYRHGSELDWNEGSRKSRAGPITVNDWVDAVVRLGKDLSDLFGRLNPRKIPSPLESKRKALEHWLKLHGSGRNPSSGLTEG